ncbi:acyltransferase family protein [Fictibacillus gelatini]|uniref:acyltransferase family protein n=1 Tax=Fictibacillus gelatini TaxID=225985 RepID=UPI0004270BC7|nr:acyltransferase family protein [Fictibacillus gelatini]
MNTKVKERDHYFDNAKFILIFLVVLGHFLTPIKDQKDILYTLYNFIYTFHMPAFILIAGFFTKGVFKKGYIQKILKNVLVPYIIFQIIYTIYYYKLYDKDDIHLTLFDPNWAMWFLLSLVFWNLMLVVFTRIKYSLIIAIIIGVAVGYFTEAGTYLSIQRTFVFFPIFLLGHYLEKKDFRLIFKPSMKILASLFLIALFAFYHFIIPDSSKDWLLASSSYADILGNNAWYGGFIRLGMYTIAFLATFSFLAIIPRRKMFFTEMGQRTLYIYLLHGFILKYLFTTEFFHTLKNQHAYFVVLLLAVSITLILASKPVVTIAQPLIEMRWSKLQFMLKKYRKKPAEV